eukprot:1141739-Rhodomonas_salina.2
MRRSNSSTKLDWADLSPSYGSDRQSSFRKVSMEFEISPPQPSPLDDCLLGIPQSCRRGSGKTKDCELMAKVSSVNSPSSISSSSSRSPTPLAVSRQHSDRLLNVSVRRSSMEPLGSPAAISRRRGKSREAELRQTSMSAPGTPPPSRRLRLPSVLSPDDPVFAKLKNQESFHLGQSCGSQQGSSSSLCSFETARSPSPPIDAADFIITSKRKNVEGWMFAGSSKQVDSDFDRGMLWVLMVAFVLTSIGILTSPDAHARQSRSTLK